jgi:hypothetical protein
MNRSEEASIKYNNSEQHNQQHAQGTRRTVEHIKHLRATHT